MNRSALFLIPLLGLAEQSKQHRQAASSQQDSNYNSKRLAKRESPEQSQSDKAI